MKTNTIGYTMRQRPTSFTLPRIKTESANQNSENKKSSPLFKSLSQEDLLLPDSNVVVKTWLLVQPQPDSFKHVKFAGEIPIKAEKMRLHSRIALDTTDALPDIEQNVQQLDLTAFTPIQPGDHNENESPTSHGNRLAAITGPQFYRSNNNKAFSMSSTASSSTIRSRHLSFLSNSSSGHHPASSVEAPTSMTSSTMSKDRASNLTLLEFDSCLSEYDRKKFDEIRQQVPDEFEQLLPTLLKLGVVLWPKKLFDNDQKLTTKEMRQRQRLLSIIDRDQQDSQRQRRLQRLYGSVVPQDDIHKRHLIRETLSFQGQLSLLESYRDEIESELYKKIKNWRSIPMRPIRRSFNEDTNSMNRSSIISNTFHAKQKFLRTLSLRSHQSNSNIYQSTNEDLFPLTFPDKVDAQWQRKSLVKVIEQGMDILDQARKLRQPSLINKDEDYNHNGQTVVRTFKRWLFLWSTLYTDDKCLR